MQQALARRYADLFSEFMRHRSQMTRVTFWGVTDTGSWLNNWPVRGRADYPLLFDRQCQAKPAFDAVIAIAQGKSPTIDGSMPAPMNWTANEDHQNMMEQLGIKTLRPGANGNDRKATNYQNTDESKANPYPNLPDPLTLKNGEKVTTPDMWWNQRRPEIVEDFDREVYGRVPANVPKVHWEVTKTTTETNGTVPVLVKQLSGRVDNSSYPLISVDIQLTLTTPANAKGAVPVMMEYGFGSFPGFGGVVLAERTLPAQPTVFASALPPGNRTSLPKAGATRSLFRPAIRRTTARGKPTGGIIYFQHKGPQAG